MGTERRSLHRRGVWSAGVLGICLCATLISACSTEEATPEVWVSDSAEVGKTLEGGGWAVTLLAQPELTKRLGSGSGTETTGGMSEGGGQTGVRIADGMWLIVIIEMVNESDDLAMYPKDLLTVTGDRGDEYEVGTRKEIGPLINADDRWEGQSQNQLINWVFEVGLPREGPLVFDVPEDATGLKLVMEGTEETIDLGF